MTEPRAANPLATDEQADVTAHALRIMAMPEIARGRQAAEFWWKSVLQNDPSDEAWAGFPAAMDDYVFNYVLKAVNSDGNYPRVAHVYIPPRAFRGMDVPGSRWGGDNPDNIYRLIPIDAKARYRLDGRRIGSGPSNVSYTLVANYETSKTLNGIEDYDLEYDADGGFSITLDSQPANGRRNHIQTRPGARYLFIRDSLGDWDQQPNALTIHRLDPPDAPPMTDQQIAERAAEIMVDGVPLVYWFLRVGHGTPNAMPSVQSSGGMGGLVTQRNSIAGVELTDDDAFVVTVHPSDAAYFSLVAHNYWFITVDYARHTSTRNNAQSAVNADGSVTYVVSVRDPGVHNWIDTGGLHSLILLLRLQGLSGKAEQEPWAKSELVRFDDLRRVLPVETQWVTPEERAAERAARAEQISRRLSDR